MDQRQQRLRIPRLEHQAVVLVTLAEGVDEILAPDLVGPEAVRRGVVFEVPGERLEDQGDCGQALLAVIDQTGRPVGVEGIDGGDVHDGSEEVLAHVLALAGVENVVPELAAMPLRPGVSALVDGDAELRRLPDEVEEESFTRCAWDAPGQWDAARAHSGLPGTAPHPTLHATPGDVKAPVRSIGVAWRTMRPSLGSSTAFAMPGTMRPRTPGHSSGSSSAPSNGTNAGTTICVSSSRSSRSSGRNRRWRHARRWRHGRGASTNRFTGRCWGRRVPSTSITSSPSPAPSASMPNGLRATWRTPPWIL